MISSDSISLLFRATGDTDDARRAFRALYADAQKIAGGINLGNLRNSFRGLGAQIDAVGAKMKSLGGGMQSLGRSIRASLTLPLAGAAYALGRYGFSLDELRNQMTAFEGSAEKGEARLKSLRDLVDQTAGATREGAYEIYGLLKPLNATDKTIDTTVAAIGRLKLGFKNMIPADFVYNLTQIFGQNFEEQDIKQAIGQVPKFREYLAKAFGTGDNETLRQMKESGKITMESFFTGIAEAVESDPSLAGLQEPVRLRMQKLFERTFEALEPLATRIVSVLERIVTLASPYIEQFGKWFAELSPVFQNLIVIVGLFSAALGPVTLALGAVISAGGTVVTTITAIAGIINPVTVAIGAALLGLGAAAAALYAAWQTNFGGIRDAATEAFSSIKNTVSPAWSEVYEFFRSTVADLADWWDENYSEIERTVKTVSDSTASAIRVFLDTVYALWKKHGEGITRVVSNYWNFIKTNISNAIEIAKNLLKLGMQIINGDWDGAWKTVLEIVKTAVRSVAEFVRNLRDLVGRYFLELVKIAAEYIVRFNFELMRGFGKIIASTVTLFATLPFKLRELAPQFLAAGSAIGSAIWQGIKDALAGRSAEGADVSMFGTSTDPGGARGGLSGGGTSSNNAAADAISKQKEDAEKLRRERERQRDEDMQSRINMARNEAEEIKKIFSDTVSSLQEQFTETGDKELFVKAFNTALVEYGNQIRNVIGHLIELENAQAQLAGASSVQMAELVQEQKARAKDLLEFSETERQKVSKAIIEGEKKAAEETLKAARSRIQQEIDLDKSANDRALAGLSAEIDNRRILQTTEQGLLIKHLEFKKAKLKEELEAVRGNAEEEAKIQHDLKLLENEIDIERFEQTKQIREFEKEELEQAKRLELEVLEVKKEVLKVERERENFQRAQERKILQNTYESANGRARIEALRTLRDFDLEEERRRHQARLLELDEERRAALEKIEGKQNEEEQKFQIEELYKQRKLLSEEEFQKRLKEIKESSGRELFDLEASQSFFGQFSLGVLRYLEDVVLIEDANGRMQFSFSQLFTSLTDMAMQAFGQLAQGFGQMVANWVLYGNQGQQSFRKMVAGVLANIAQMATTYAVMCLAAAALATTVWGAAILGGTPGQFLAAAALFGSVALATALAGRAVAGNSFRRETSGGFGSAQGGTRSTQGAGGSNDPRILTEDRMQRQEPAKIIEMRLPQGMVAKEVINDINTMGEIRSAIIKVAEI